MNAEFWDQAGAGRRAGARVRHLPRLPPLREPVPRLPHPVRPDRRIRDAGDRRRRQGRLRQGRRAVLPVRPVLPDQVPVRAAASVERRFSAPDAARQGGAVPPRRRAAEGPRCCPTRAPWASWRRFRWWCRRSMRPNRIEAGAQAAGKDPGRAPRGARARVPLADRAQAPEAPGRQRRGRSRPAAPAARSPSSPPATATTPCPGRSRTWPRCSSTTRSPCAWSSARAAAACPSSSWATWRPCASTRRRTSRCWRGWSARAGTSPPPSRPAC